MSTTGRNRTKSRELKSIAVYSSFRPERTLSGDVMSILPDSHEGLTGTALCSGRRHTRTGCDSRRYDCVDLIQAHGRWCQAGETRQALRLLRSGPTSPGIVLGGLNGEASPAVTDGDTAPR